MKHNTTPKIRMRLLILAALMLPALAAGAQRETIKFTKTQLTAREALAEIKTQAGYGLVFNGQQFDADRTVTLTAAELTFAEAMKQILDGSDSSYTLNDNFISITKSAEISVKEDAPAPRKSDPVSDNIYSPDPAPDLNSGPHPAQTVESVVQPEPIPVAVAAVPYSQPEPVSRDSVIQISVPTVALKTNLLYDLTATINLGLEFRLGGRTSLDVPVSWNPFTFKDNRKWRHILVQPELRLWTRETFEGHFFGLHAHYAFYNVGNLPKPFSQYMRDHRFQGWLAGAGVSYGYRWNFNPNWGMEATVGVGYAYMDYEKFECRTCGDSFGKETKHYFGPTKIGLSLVYNIGRKKQSATVPVYVAPYVPEYVEPTVPEEPVVAVVPSQPEPEPEPEPAPVVIPPTTAEQLAETHRFLAPVSEFGVGFLTDRQRYIEDHRDGSLSVYFRQGGGIIDHSYKNNAATLDEILSTIRQIESSPDSRVALVVIAGFASPEGPAALNDRLAQQRAETIKNYLTENSALSGNKIEIHNGGIDWSGLHKLVEASDMAYRQQALDILDNTPVWDARRSTGRHGELMRLGGGEPYRYMLRNFFPELRNATYIRVYFENTQITD